MGFFGGGGTTTDRIKTAHVQDVGYGSPIKICYGTNRVAPLLGTLRDFEATEHEAGKGLGGGSTWYTYKASVMMFICEGQVRGIGRLWRNKDKHANYTKAGFNFARSGGMAQTAWPFLLSTNAPEALNYSNTALIAGSGYDLGTEATIGSHSIEVFGRCLSTQSTDQNYTDAYIKDVVDDFLHNPYYGALDASTTTIPLATDDMHAYCCARNILISPVLDTQKPAHDYLTEWALVANAGIVWSEGRLKFRPYADEAFTGHGVSYVPNTAIMYIFDDDNVDEPIQPTRKKPVDCYNKVAVECLNRAKEYNKFTIDVSDQANIAQFGLRPDAVLSLSCLLNPVIAKIVAHTVLQRGLYIRNTYEISTFCEADQLEPLDFVSITDVGLGLDNVRCRITSIRDEQDGRLHITVEEAPEGVYCG